MRARAAAEFGRIPEFHGLGSADSTFVEYLTGEREFYELTHDPDEIDNLASKAPADAIGARAQRVKRLQNSAAANARAIENEP